MKSLEGYSYDKLIAPIQKDKKIKRISDLIKLIDKWKEKN